MGVEILNKGHSFEVQVAKYFRRRGFKVTVTPKSRDHGIDILMLKHKKQTGVECKCYAQDHKVGREVIQKFDSALNHNPYSEKPLDYGYVITTSTFTPDAYSAVELMNKHYGYTRIKLIDGNVYRSLIRRDSHRWFSKPQLSWQQKVLIILGAVFLFICTVTGAIDVVKTSVGL